jgi:hypothetical protein
MLPSYPGFVFRFDGVKQHVLERLHFHWFERPFIFAQNFSLRSSADVRLEGKTAEKSFHDASPDQAGRQAGSPLINLQLRFLRDESVLTMPRSAKPELDNGDLVSLVSFGCVH